MPVAAGYRFHYGWCCVLVVSWTDVCDMVVDWSCSSCSSCSMMMVPPPWAISWSMRLEGASGVLGMDGAGHPCWGIGRKVMVVLCLVLVLRVCAALSIFWAVMVVVDVLVLERCLLLRQACIRRIDARMIVVLMRCVVFIVCSISLCCVNHVYAQR